MLTISLSKKEGVFNTQSIYLHDKKLNFYHDLTQAAYFFYPDNTLNRFEVVYKLNASDEDVIEEEEINIQAAILNSEFTVTSNIPLSKIELFDINGKLISFDELEQNNLVF